MAQKTLLQILQGVGAYVDQDRTAPTGTDELGRVELVDQALTEWGNAYQWKQLRNQSPVTFVFSGTSFALDIRFKKLMSQIVDVTKQDANEYVEIEPQERFSRASLSRGTSLSNRFVYIIGNDVTGRALVLSPALPSGASLNYDWQAFPSSMATLTDICVCPHPEFIIKRTIGLILETRSDTRFPQVKADADTLLARMIEEEQSSSLGENNRIQDWARQANYSVGFD